MPAKTMRPSAAAKKQAAPTPPADQEPDRLINDPAGRGPGDLPPRPGQLTGRRRLVDPTTCERRLRGRRAGIHAGDAGIQAAERPDVPHLERGPGGAPGPGIREGRGPRRLSRPDGRRSRGVHHDDGRFHDEQGRGPRLADRRGHVPAGGEVLDARPRRHDDRPGLARPGIPPRGDRPYRTLSHRPVRIVGGRAGPRPPTTDPRRTLADPHRPTPPRRPARRFAATVLNDERRLVMFDPIPLVISGELDPIPPGSMSVSRMATTCRTLHRPRCATPAPCPPSLLATAARSASTRTWAITTRSWSTTSPSP